MLANIKMIPLEIAFFLSKRPAIHTLSLFFDLQHLSDTQGMQPNTGTFKVFLGQRAKNSLSSQDGSSVFLQEDPKPHGGGESDLLGRQFDVPW